jgi:hypothetical protein
MDIKRAKTLASEWNNLKQDMDRLRFLKKHNKEMKAILDNDITMVGFILPDDIDLDLEELINEIELDDFDDYHYWSDGCLLLFEFAGITAEAC